MKWLAIAGVLVWPCFRRVWLVVMAAFHLIILATMNIFFWENLVLLLVVFGWVRTEVPHAAEAGTTAGPGILDSVPPACRLPGGSAMRSAVVRVTLISASVFAAAAIVGAQRGAQQAQVFVVDRSNAPVSSLSARDFVVREDGTTREVASVTPAAPPSPIVLLVDNSQAAEPAIAYLRKALSGFVTAFATRETPPRLGFWTFGERPTKVVTEATAGIVGREIDRLFHRPSTGAHMLQAIVEASADLVKAKATQPALVAFVVESGVEFSQEDHQRVAQALRRAGASLWVVALQSRAAALNESLENRERAAVIGDVTTESGGLHLMVLSPQGLPDAFQQLQRILTSRVTVAYARPESLVPPERLEITTTREDLRVLAPRWAGR